ncbi:membrane protein [Prevotella bivia DNF00320]|uniref:Membrane protein n=1 Tax=Prevotella bivia DNF00320 TaxID=1401068 RepID=A0A096AAM3_9BACT|nr:EpsG family protein [Prevotella bivia]KGF43606.1 membrane protein [Prevotella bivia DNF00320]
MFIYLLVFIVAFIYYILSRENSFLRKSSVALSFFFLYVALFVGLGDMIGGYDRYIYGEVFDTIADEFQHTSSPNINKIIYLVTGKEYGYFFWQILISYITQNRYIFILITTIAIYVLFFLAFKEYLDDYPLACIVFLGLFYYFSMTYLRQVIGVGFTFLSVKYIVKRKFLPFFCFWLLAYSFHGSALIFFPMYFIPQKKYSKNFVITVLLLCLIVSLTPLPNALLSSGITASGKAQNYMDQDQGFRIEYVIEVVAFISIFFMNYGKINKEKQTLVFLNMSYVFCALLLLFMRFGQGGRLGWYFMPGIIYMTTYLCNRKDVAKWLKPAMILLFFGLFFRITLAWRPLNVPYKTFLTNGQPAGDGSTYEDNEYDERYNIDKFFR